MNKTVKKKKRNVHRDAPKEKNVGDYDKVISAYIKTRRKLTKMKQYVVGFAFDHTMDHVLMLKRKKPPYQHLYNGVGGKIENGENPEQAMFRETPRRNRANKD